MIIQQIWTILLLLSTIAIFAISQKPWEAVEKDKKWWKKKHREFHNTTATLGKDIKVVFIGSSSVEYWSKTAKDVWDKQYANLGAVNYGLRADKTENLLWRIEHGELDGLDPKLVVIYIGSNNVPRFPEDECVRGVNAVIDKIHEKLPNSNLLYVGFFPRGDRTPVKATLTKIRNITETLKPMIEGNGTRRAHFLDLFFSYAPSSMETIFDEYYQKDKLHQNLKGYEMWERLMNNVFHSLMETK